MAAPADAPRSVPPPGDAEIARLGEERWARWAAEHPVWATSQGIGEHDGRLGTRRRDRVEQELEDERRWLADVEAIDPRALSEEGSIEREVALLLGRRAVFDLEVERQWERRPTAADEIGDGVFYLLVRDHLPLPDRLERIIDRIADAPRLLTEQRALVEGERVRLWHALEARSAGHLHALFADVRRAAIGAWGEDTAPARRLDRSIARANEALEAYRVWLREDVAAAGDGFALGPERLEELLSIRALDGLTGDDILAIGEEQLAASREARQASARALDPAASEAEVIERVKSDHAATFAEALEEYAASIRAAREHVESRGLVTLPQHDVLRVMETPEYLRSAMPFAAYFPPAPLHPEGGGIYVVTPSVDDDTGAMREHNRPSISNVSIHEAYPGHHLQLTAALAHPSRLRLMIEATEFVEGWGMYCEQMMREEGFDTAPASLVAMHTDAIWRACRIVLDIRLHRAEVGLTEATDWLVEQTGFERPQAAAEVERYTYSPGYQLSYLLGKVMLLQLREDEQRRLGAAFSLRGFHDALVYGGSIPISLHRRALAGSSAAAPRASGQADGISLAAAR